MSNKGGKRSGAGRKKGEPNKFTKQIKEAIVEAFEKSGGVAYLVKVAKNDPKTFCTLLGRILPPALEDQDTRPISIEVNIG